MKKALAALFASFVGLFGYQIVDKAIEERVNNLEYQVSSQQEEIESLHHLGKYGNVNEEITIPSFYSEASSLNIGDTQKYTGQTKFLFREYADGSVVFISTSDSNSINNIKIFPANEISFKSRNEDQAEIAPAKEETPKSAETPAIAPPTTYADGKREYINDFYIYINDASRKIVNKKDNYTKLYDENYSVQSRKSGFEYSVRYIINGNADLYFAGKEVLIYTSENICIKTIINNDGTFSVDTEIKQTRIDSSFNSLKIQLNLDKEAPKATLALGKNIRKINSESE